MSSESDWMRVEEEDSEVEQVINVEPEELMTNAARTPIAFKELPEYQLFYQDDSEVQLLRVPSGSLSASSVASSERIEENEEPDYISILRSIEKPQIRKHKIFMFSSTLLFVLILASSIAMAWMMRTKIILMKKGIAMDTGSPDKFEIIGYGTTEVQERIEPHILQIMWVRYTRYFMSVLRTSHNIGEAWKDCLLAGGHRLLNLFQREYT